MTDVELRLTANIDEATRDVRTFSKTYKEMVGAVEKPLRRVTAFRDLETSLESTQKKMREVRDRVRELGTELANTAAPSQAMQQGYRSAVNELKGLERSEGTLTNQIARRRSELQAAGIDTKNLATEQSRLADELTRALGAGRADAALGAARQNLGVGGIEATQLQLVGLREQYRLLTRDGNLSAKERAEAEATYRRSVGETLERLRSMREATRQNASQAEREALATAQRHEAARMGIRRLAAEQQLAAVQARQAGLEQARNDLGVNRYRALQAEIVQVRNQFELLRRSGGLTNRELALAQRAMTQRVRETQQALREMNAEQRRGMAGLGGMLGVLGPVAGGYAALRGVRGVSNISDGWVEMTDRIRIATGSQANFESGMERLEAISDRTYTSMANNAELFIQSLSPLRERGFGEAETLQFIEAIGLGLVASAAKGQRAEGVINQLSGALQTGELRGDAFNSMLRVTPALADALATGLGKTREQLAEMAREGQLTTDVWVPALISQTDTLGTAVDGMAVTVEDAMTRLNNAWTKAIGESDVSPLVQAIEDLREVISDPAVMEGLTNLASLLVSIAGIAVQSGGEVGDLAGRFGFALRQARGLTGELEEMDRQIKDLDRSIAGTGMNTTLAGLFIGRDQLVQMREALVARRNLMFQNKEEEVQIDSDRLTAYRSYVSSLDGLRKEQLDKLKSWHSEQKRLETAALRDIEKIRADRTKIEERYDDALLKIRGGGGPGSFLQASGLRGQAQRALQAGDLEQASKLAQRATQMLVDLAEAGDNTYGYEGLLSSLRAVEMEASRIEETRAEEKLAALRQSMADVEEQAKALQDMPVSVDLDEAALAGVREKLLALARDMKQELILPVTVTAPSLPANGRPADPDVPMGFAEGGWTGPGGKYKFAGYVHADEYVQPKSRMQEPGALAFMERFRRYGMRALPGYAEGGLVGRALPYLPPAPAGNTNSPSGTPLHLSIGGETHTVYGDADVIGTLARAVRTQNLRSKRR